MIIVRSPYSLSKNQFEAAKEKLIKHAVYVGGAPLDQAPYKADCLSAVIYLINQSSAQPDKIPMYWIGNAPQRLIERWDFKVVENREMQLGDLIFTQSNNNKSGRLITHVLIAISQTHLFHCTNKVRGCEEIDLEQFQMRFHQPFSVKEMLNYLDPRSRSFANEVAQQKR